MGVTRVYKLFLCGIYNIWWRMCMDVMFCFGCGWYRYSEVRLVPGILMYVFID